MVKRMEGRAIQIQVSYEQAQNQKFSDMESKQGIIII